MSREVRHDGTNTFEVRFTFDRELVDLIKTLPHRRWNAAERLWAIPAQDVVMLVDLLQPLDFRFDSATCEAYRQFGGTLEITDAAPAVDSSRLPGLFDDEAPAAVGAPPDYTVSRLNETVRRLLEDAFPGPVWLIGEISGFNRNAHKRHVTFQIEEKDADGKTVSTVGATLFDRTRRDVERALAAAGEPFRLEDEITVRLEARVELYVPWGSYRVIVERLDVAYTLGEAARRREEIVRRLTDEGLIGLNSGLEMPALPLRVGLVTSLGSDAYNDVLRTFQESGYAFRVLAHGARVQGRATEPSVLNALDALRSRRDDLDVVVICRGGGARTDLAWFDSEALGRAVASFPLPVVVGIGHEQDRSVLDDVGRRAKTPTAAAALLVEAVRCGLQAIETLGLQALTLAARRLRDEHREGLERARRLGLAARSLLDRELIELGHRRRRGALGARALVVGAGERIRHLVRNVPKAVSVHLTRQQTFLDNAGRGLTRASRRSVQQEAERTEARDRRLALVEPRRVIDRGYAILRTSDGRVLTGAGGAPSGTLLTAQMKRGDLALRSLGPTAHGEEG